MSISSNSLLEKMQQEVEQAKIKQLNNEDITVHLSKVQLLCELLLEDNRVGPETKETVTTMSKQEKLAMFGKAHKEHTAVTTKAAEKSADDFSIFDF